MPLYNYLCPKNHIIEKLVSMKDREVPQLCEEHNEMCEKTEFDLPSHFIWGINEVAWTAGLSSDPHGMGKYKNK